MKITLGEWKTRDGRKAIVVGENPNGHRSQKLVGWVGEHAQAWGINGAWSSEEGNNSKLDLIAPWTDPVPWDWSTTPPWISCVIQGPSGNWYMCENDASTCEVGIMFNGDNYIQIPRKYSPKWSGDWKLSKTMRPKGVAK